MNKIFLPVKCSEMYCTAKKNPQRVVNCSCKQHSEFWPDLIYPIDAVMQSPVLCKLR